jgi:hypothetical protein
VDFQPLQTLLSRHYATSRKVAGSNPDEVIIFFNWHNPSSRTMALGSTQPLTEMSTRNLPGGKGAPALKADNLTAMCKTIAWKLWKLRRLTTLCASTACYRDNFTLPSTDTTKKKREKPQASSCLFFSPSARKPKIFTGKLTCPLEIILSYVIWCRSR